jgi:hypothetical protein
MPRKVLVAFVDALGPDQLAAAGDRFDFAPHRRALDGVLGYSSGALATILTGAHPEAHGRMCLFTRREPGAASPLDGLGWLGLLPRLVHERERVRRLAASLVARRHGLTGYLALHRIPPRDFAWLDVPERDDLFATDAIGGRATFLADARRAGLSVAATPWQLPEAERFEAVLADARRARPDLTFLYAAELDGVLHREGNDARATREAAARAAGRIARVRDELARSGGDLLTIVVGDHGMADVRRLVDPRPLLAGAAVRAFVDSTLLRVWGPAPARAALRARLEDRGAPGRWLDADDLALRRAPVRGAPYGDAIFVLDEGHLFAPSHLGGAVRGMHGYDVGAPSARAALASDRPLPDGATSLADVASMVRAWLLPS